MKTEQLTRRNFLKKASLVGILGGGFSGCGKGYKYVFDGEIDGEKIKFQVNFVNNNYCLEVTKQNGIKKMYIDYDSFGDVNKLIITIDGKKRAYTNNEIEKPVLEEAQKQYTIYLGKILKEKDRIRQETKQEEIREGLDLIKK